MLLVFILLHTQLCLVLASLAVSMLTSAPPTLKNCQQCHLEPLLCWSSCSPPDLMMLLVINWFFFLCCSYYAKLRQQEMERERELAEKYRDRARERRDGVNKDYEETELISTTANYRAVGPTAEAWVMLITSANKTANYRAGVLTLWYKYWCIRCVFSVISQQRRNGVSWSRSQSFWEVTWSTLTWWKVWISLCCRRWESAEQEEHYSRWLALMLTLCLDVTDRSLLEYNTVSVQWSESVFLFFN